MDYFYPNRKGQQAAPAEDEEDDLYGGFGTYEDEYDAVCALSFSLSLCFLCVFLPLSLSLCLSRSLSCVCL